MSNTKKNAGRNVKAPQSGLSQEVKERLIAAEQERIEREEQRNQQYRSAALAAMHSRQNNPRRGL